MKYRQAGKTSRKPTRARTHTHVDFTVFNILQNNAKRSTPFQISIRCFGIFRVVAYLSFFVRSLFLYLRAETKVAKVASKLNDPSLTESRRAANQESKVGWFDNYKWQVNLSLSLSLSLSLATKRSINFSHSFSRNTGFPL